MRCCGQGIELNPWVRGGGEESVLAISIKRFSLCSLKVIKLPVNFSAAYSGYFSYLPNVFHCPGQKFVFNTHISTTLKAVCFMNR